MIVKLCLPPPSINLLHEINRVASAAPLEIELKQMHDKIQNFTKNSVSRKFIEDDEIFNKLALKEFSPFFEEKIKPAVGIVKNVQPGQYACWPPHADRVRIFALNFYVSEGGNHVTTVMYDKYGDYKVGVGTGEVFKYKELNIDKEYHLETNSWYALSVRQVHSIEHIETTRIIFTLSFFDITCAEFIKKYPQYVKQYITDS